MGAAWLGAAYTERQANARLAKERKHKLADDAAADGKVEAVLKAKRASSLLILALHLERYAEECANTVSDNSEPDLEFAAGLPKFPPWPAIDWDVIGASETATVRDIETMVRLRESYVQADVHYAAVDANDAAGFYSVGAAKTGLEAWRAAVELRDKAKVPPLGFPPDGEGWNFVETLEREVARHLQEREDARS